MPKTSYDVTIYYGVRAENSISVTACAVNDKLLKFKSGQEIAAFDLADVILKAIGQAIEDLPDN